MIEKGNSLELLKKIESNTVDCMVTDPPYGISFMNKDWDKAVPDLAIWKECLRVMKPGAFAFVMCSPRSDVQAEMVIKLKDAGFEVNFSPIYWTYACLSSDTEVLSLEYGWIEWEQIRKSKTHKYIHILTYDNESNSYKWEIPSRWNEYQIKDTCYRIKSDSTDQLVSRGHRVYFEREGKLLWDYAERLFSNQTIQVPILDEVPDVQQYNIPAIQTKRYNRMFKGLPKKTNIYKQQREMGYIGDKKNKENLPMLWKGVLHLSSLVKEGRELRNVLFYKLQTESEYTQISSDMAENTPIKMVSRKDRSVEEENNWIRKPILERWSNVFQNTWKLYRSKIYPMSEGIFVNGKKGWICNGTSDISSSTDWETFIEIGGSSSYRSRSKQQFSGESDVVFIQPRAQEIRAPSRPYKTTLATISKEYYEGKIFCPTVSTGIFVAKRNGKIFLTGNSGFPKAMNVSKAVDRKLGVEPKVIGIAKGMAKQNPEFNGTAQGRKENYLKPEYEKTTPTSEEAKRLTGSYGGFQPKPAVEVIIVAMKPLSEKTYVDQALKNGKGITWLDDGRIPYQSEKDKESAIGIGGSFSGKSFDTGRYHFNVGNSFVRSEFEINVKGRFPANLLVQDDVLDNGIISKSGTLLKKHTITKGQTGSFTPDDWTEKEQHPSKDYPSDEGSLSRYFSLDAWYSKHIEELPDYIQRIFPFLYVPKASKGEREKNLDDLPETSSINGDKWTDMDRRENNKPTLRRNFHPTVKPLKLMTYLITIGSRPGDTILDPFLGSGTTGVAAAILNRNFIGFEINESYFEIAENRIKARQTQSVIEAYFNDNGGSE